MLIVNKHWIIVNRGRSKGCQYQILRVVCMLYSTWKLQKSFKSWSWSFKSGTRRLGKSWNPRYLRFLTRTWKLKCSVTKWKINSYSTNQKIHKAEWCGGSAEVAGILTYCGFVTEVNKEALALTAKLRAAHVDPPQLVQGKQMHRRLIWKYVLMANSCTA